MKRFSTIITILALLGLAQAQAQTVSLVCKLSNCSSLDSLTLYKFSGTYLVKVSSQSRNASQEFVFNVAKTANPQFYFVGPNLDEEKVKPVILGTESTVVLTGPCFDPRQSTANSALNTQWEAAGKRVNELKMEMGGVINEYRANYQNETLRKGIEQKMVVVDGKKLAYLDSIRKTNVWLSKLVALDTYTSFQGVKNPSAYKDEIEYFATNYFQYANLQDAEYNNLPMMYDLFKSYADVMCLVGLKDDVQAGYFDKLLKKLPEGTPAHQYALGGIVHGLIAKSHPNTLKYGNLYTEKYKQMDMVGCSRINHNLGQMRSNMMGIEAPDIKMNNINDQSLALSSLRGKIVLIDFWASWCGPCRRENPNVVKLYNEFKDKGFDVFSVSLDKDKERWLKAIADDGLIWNSHVSDLLGWQNAGAQLYSVSSIPHTVLIDREGKIIARNLRGEQLDQKVRELIGN